MKEGVSKVRAKRAKEREKNAGKVAPQKWSIKTSPYVGFATGLFLWVVSIFIVSPETLPEAVDTPFALISLFAPSIYLLISILVAALLLELTRPELLRRNDMVVMMGLICLLPIILMKIIIHFSTYMGGIQPEILMFMAPLTIAPLLTTILLGPRAGISAGIFSSLACAIMLDNSLIVLVEGLVATTISCHLAKRVRTRSKVSKIGLIIGVAKMSCVLGATAMGVVGAQTVLTLHQALACLASGFISAILALIILPGFEYLFSVTSDITLLELSDLGNPILQRLALEAPGTYHHSLVVANLAQAAAEEIGANSLLARVCAYYHDIGKLTKPEFFAENIRMTRNPHDDLPPSMSTLVITAHVKEGISMAMLHKLPGPIMDVIREHHGTSLISCFHHKAKTQFEEDSEYSDAQKSVDEGSFRYGGPVPQSPESSIICLADPIEAASRSMEKTTPGNIENLVDEIVTSRFEDGQLDRANITLAQLTHIKRSFVFTLTNMLHGRVPYPKDENRNKQSTENSDQKEGDKQPVRISGKENGKTDA